MNFRINCFQVVWVTICFKSPLTWMCCGIWSLFCPVWGMITCVILIVPITLFFWKIIIWHFSTNIEATFALCLIMIIFSPIAVFMVGYSFSSFNSIVVSTSWLERLVSFFCKTLIPTFWAFWFWIMRLSIFNIGLIMIRF